MTTTTRSTGTRRGEAEAQAIGVYSTAGSRPTGAATPRNAWTSFPRPRHTSGSSGGPRAQAFAAIATPLWLCALGITVLAFRNRTFSAQQDDAQHDAAVLGSLADTRSTPVGSTARRERVGEDHDGEPGPPWT